MAARPKLVGDRERRLFAVLATGESLSAACRGVQISATAVRKRAARDWIFRERLEAARTRTDVESVMGWEDAARALEVIDPARWGPLPDAVEWDDEVCP